jgi:Plasmid pRiA4b ORF-3-like protein
VAKSTAKKRAMQTAENDRRLYRLEVSIIDGPMTESFLKKNRVVSRTIQIRGDQTLAELHRAIFDAFDREEEHMYEFQIGGKGPMDPKARRYVLTAAMYDLSSEDKPAGDVEKTAIGSLNLQADDLFGYWFDFGDDWWHQIDVLAVEEKAVRGKFPKVVKRVGKSPPQYADWDEEDE